MQKTVVTNPEGREFEIHEDGKEFTIKEVGNDNTFHQQHTMLWENVLPMRNGIVKYITNTDYETLKQLDSEKRINFDGESAD